MGRGLGHGPPFEQLVQPWIARRADPRCARSVTGRVRVPANCNVRHRTDSEDESIHLTVRSQGRLHSMSLVLCRIDSPSV